jgi:hypothetical protein
LLGRNFWRNWQSHHEYASPARSRQTRRKAPPSFPGVISRSESTVRAGLNGGASIGEALAPLITLSHPLSSGSARSAKPEAHCGIRRGSDKTCMTGSGPQSVSMLLVTVSRSVFILFSFSEARRTLGDQFVLGLYIEAGPVESGSIIGSRFPVSPLKCCPRQVFRTPG